MITTTTLTELFDFLEANKSNQCIITQPPFPLGEWLKNNKEMNHACTMCGSRNWPDPDTTCPLCYGEPERDIDNDLDEPLGDACSIENPECESCQ
jgi:hypothetical protein